MKIREVFEYEVDTDDIKEVFTIKDYVECVDDMTCPFWDGYKIGESICHRLEILNK